MIFGRTKAAVARMIPLPARRRVTVGRNVLQAMRHGEPIGNLRTTITGVECSWWARRAKPSEAEPCREGWRQPLKIFLSYASEDRAVAEQISLALAAEGHDVFFDREDLPAGDAFHARIRRAIESSDQFIFLVSPQALDAGSYTLNELETAQKTWRNPAGRVLPVLLRQTELTRIPNYLKSVTLLTTEGNVVAMVVDAVHRVARARRSALLARITAGCAGLALLVAVVGLYWWNRGSAEEKTGRDGALAVRVAEGMFTMGDDENAPRREVYTDAFYMDKLEVTVARYARFLKETASVRAPEDWEEIDLEGAAQFPVTGVDWYNAQAYCRWAGRRLPTEAEWEKAARGTDGRLFPWGNESPTLQRAELCERVAQGLRGRTRTGRRAPDGTQSVRGA